MYFLFKPTQHINTIVFAVKKPFAPVMLILMDLINHDTTPGIMQKGVSVALSNAMTTNKSKTQKKPS
jgi:hypothetical protein